MTLLGIAALFVASNLGSFFRGRALNYEARRMLSLTHYAQSRAVQESVPVVLWIDAAKNTYGIEVQDGFKDTTTEDAHAVSYTADSTLSLDAGANDTSIQSEQQDDRFGLPAGLPCIRFNPDGYADEISIKRILIRQGTEAALELVPTANHLGYEIRPASLSQ